MYGGDSNGWKNVRFLGNRCSKRFYAKCGYHGPFLYAENAQRSGQRVARERTSPLRRIAKPARAAASAGSLAPGSGREGGGAGLDLLTLVRIMLRRWYVVIPVALLSLLAAGATYASIEPTYQASGSVLLLNPQSQVDPESGKANPYVGNLDGRGEGRHRRSGLPRVQAGVPPARDNGHLHARADPSSPIVVVTTIGETAESARETTRTVMGAIDDVLRRAAAGPRRTTVDLRHHAGRHPAVGSGAAEREPDQGEPRDPRTGTGADDGRDVRRRGRHPPARSWQRDRPQPPAPVRGEHSAECPFCDEVLPGRDLVGHLADVHGLTGSGESPAVYALPDRRGSTARIKHAARRDGGPALRRDRHHHSQLCRRCSAPRRARSRRSTGARRPSRSGRGGWPPRPG